MSSRKKSFRPKPNFKWPLITVTIVLFIGSLSAFVFSHSSELIKHYKEQLALVVELSENIADAGIAQITDYLTSSEQVLAQSVTFISKEEGLELMLEDMGLDRLEEAMPNPLFDIIQFNCRASSVNQEEINALRQGLLDEFPDVVAVHYQDYLVNYLFGNLAKSMWIMLAILVCILGIALLLIISAIKLDLFDQRRIIRNMELIGASWRFIRRPFLKKGIRQASLCVSLSLALSSAVVFGIYLKIPAILNILRPDYILMITGATILIGLLIYQICIYTSVNKYLRSNPFDSY